MALAFGLCLSGSAAGSSERVVKVGVDNRLYPYAFINGKGEPDGFNVDLIKALAAEIKIPIKIVSGEWSSVRGEFERGKLDVLGGFVYSSERERKVNFSNPFMTMHCVFFVRRDQQSSMEAIAQQKVAVRGNDMACEFLTKLQKFKEVVLTANYEEAMKTVMRGNADAVFVPRTVGLALLNKKHYYGLTINSHYPELEFKYCFAVGKDQFDLLTSINEGLFLLKQKGIYKDIYTKWFGNEIGQAWYQQYLAKIMFVIGILVMLAGCVLMIRIKILKTQMARQVAEKNTVLRRIKEQDDFFETVFNNNPDPSYLLSWDIFVDVTPSACDLLGFDKKDELIGKSIYEVSVECQSDGRRSCDVFDEYLDMVTEKRPMRFEWEHRKVDGTVIPSEVTMSVITMEGQSLYLLVWRDLTSKKMIEQALLEAEYRYRLISENVSDVIWIYDVESDLIKFITKSSTRMTGHRPEDVIGKNPVPIKSNLSGLPFEKKLAEQIAAFSAGDMQSRVMTSKIELEHCNGKKVMCEVVSTLLTNAKGEVKEILGVSRDITEREAAETERLELARQMLQSQKLESLGIMAGGIAHDFNNLLTTIMGNLDLTHRRLPVGSREKHFIEQSLIAAKRAAELTAQMLAYSGKGRFYVQDLELGNFIRDHLAFMQSIISKKINFRLELDSQPVVITADQNQLQQVIINLLSNAAESIGDRTGNIIMQVGVRQYSEVELVKNRGGEQLGGGRYGFLQVVDDGCGMNKLMLERIFEPFFTTKFTGRGMGMAAVLGIIRSHKGGIDVVSEEGVGTKVTVILPVKPVPLIQTKEPEMQINEPISKDSGGMVKGTVLVVEDEAMVRRLCCDMIEESGYKTLSAADGQEGIDVFKQHSGEIACVLLDLSMPVKDGLVVFETIKGCCPTAKVILSSGYSAQDATSRFDGKGLSGFIQKPYVMDDLTKLLDRVIAAPINTATITKP